MYLHHKFIACRFHFSSLTVDMSTYTVFACDHGYADWNCPPFAYNTTATYLQLGLPCICSEKHFYLRSDCSDFNMLYSRSRLEDANARLICKNKITSVIMYLHWTLQFGKDRITCSWWVTLAHLVDVNCFSVKIGILLMHGPPPAYDAPTTSPTHSPVATGWKPRSVFRTRWRQSSIVHWTLRLLATWLQICAVCLTCRPDDVWDHHSLISSMSASCSVQLFETDRLLCLELDYLYIYLRTQQSTSNIKRRHNKSYWVLRPTKGCEPLTRGR